MKLLTGVSLKGKTVVPFSTSISSGLGSSAKHLKTKAKISSKTKWLKGRNFYDIPSQKLDADHYGSVDVERVKKMADLFMENGFTYFDTAWMYAGFASENVAKEALVDRHPRDSFTLAAKLHAGLPDCFIFISFCP